MTEVILPKTPYRWGTDGFASRLNHTSWGVAGPGSATAETRPTGGVCEDFRLTAVAYRRVSTDQQAESGLGLDAQRVAIDRCAVHGGLRVRDGFVDVLSGGTASQARPQLMEAIASLRRGEVLLVAKRDRLGRDAIEVAMIERLIAKRRARVVSAAGEGSGDEPADLLMRRMVDAFAEYERLLIAARTKAALAVKIAQHERAGNLPYGEQLDPDGKHTAPAPVERRIVATMLEQRALLHTMKEISATLNAEGFTTRAGTPWRPEYVARRLRKVAG